MRMVPASDIPVTLRVAAATATSNFAAVLLAGGRSSRMGRDKALLPIAGVPLWQHQLAKLRALGPTELFISARRDSPCASAGVELVEDAAADRGPLGGIAAVLARITQPRLLVLAVDLPEITVEFLQTLVAESGCPIPQRDAFLEPLAAVYPRSAAALAVAALAREELSMQHFCRGLIAAQLAVPRPLAPGEVSLFRNLNEPADLPPPPTQ